MNSGCFQIVIIIFNLLYIFIYIYNKLPLKSGRWGEALKTVTTVTLLGLGKVEVLMDDFLLPAVFGVRKHRETFYIT